MAGSRMRVFWTSLAILALASAGPLHRYPRESEDYQNDLSVYANYTANEVCFSEGEVFQKGDMMPNPGPCEECRCEPPSIVCNMIKCPTNNNGCRTIQRANHCCPDYNCECDYNGQLYNDGERLELPEEPCQVCYCKGGEVMCNSITCYHRDDCDPIQVPGQCCPKYENCPVRDMASSSFDDKNILLRSNNKANHVPPKREMNPWLLTKVPAVSSMSPPKSSQDPTTEGANIIIVSDWLSERKTTTEDATSSGDERQDHSTEEPDLFTDSDHFTTSLKQELSSDGAMIVNNSDVITPVDEVIFTRIDGPKRNQEVNSGETTTISSKDTTNPLTTGILLRVVDSESKEISIDINITEAPFYQTINDEFKGLNPSMNSSEKQVLPGARPIETTLRAHKPTKPPVQFKEADKNVQSIILTDTPLGPGALNNLEANTTKYDLPATPLYIDLTGEAKSKDVQKGITLENLFGLDELSLGEIEEETTTQDLLGLYTTENVEDATRINEFTDNSLEDQTIDESKLGKMKVPVNEVKTPLDPSTNSFIDSAVTTPFFTEVNLKDYNTVKLENISKEISKNYATELPIIKKNNFHSLNKSESEVSPVADKKVNPTENTLPPRTETTKAINNSPSPVEIKIKRNNSESSVDDETPIRGTVAPVLISNNGSSVSDASRKLEPIILERNAHLQNESSNNASSKINVDLPISMNTDNISPTIVVVTGDELDDSKELISDAPPVLDLNSHLPFLQLGGHGNIDFAMNTFGENQQTTVANEKGKLSSEKHKAVINKDTVLKQSANSSDAYGLQQKQSGSNETMLNLKTTTVNSQPADKEVKIGDQENDGVVTESTTDIIFTTPHIPLTPGDLKVLAEYLINDTITTVQAENASNYTPNQWLKGNLTQEKLSSILSAANVSIAIMNQTDDKAKSVIAETPARVGEATRFDKLQKDKITSGKNALNNVKKGNKTGFIRGKTEEYADSPKINSEPETPQNDESKEILTTVRINTEPQNMVKFSVRNTTTNTNENKPGKYQVNTHLKANYTQSQTSTPQSVNNIQSVTETPTENNLRFDNVNPAGNVETNQYNQSDLIRNKIKSDAISTSLTSKSTVTTSDPQKQPTP